MSFKSLEAQLVKYTQQSSASGSADLCPSTCKLVIRPVSAAFPSSSCFQWHPGWFHTPASPPSAEQEPCSSSQLPASRTNSATKCVVLVTPVRVMALQAVGCGLCGLPRLRHRRRHLQHHAQVRAPRLLRRHIALNWWVECLFCFMFHASTSFTPPSPV